MCLGIQYPHNSAAVAPRKNPNTVSSQTGCLERCGMFANARKRPHLRAAALAFFIGIWLVSACTPIASDGGDAGQLSGTAAFIATHLVAFSATWIDRPLDNTIIADPLKPVRIIGHATGLSVGSATLRIKQGGASLPDVTLTRFTSERQGLTR